MNASQAKLLAEKSDWKVVEFTGASQWTMAFHKPDVAVIQVRFSDTGILTKIQAVDFVNSIHRAPTRDKGTRLSHYLTEGII